MLSLKFNFLSNSVLLNLSATFGTVTHDVMVDRFKSHFGMTGDNCMKYLKPNQTLKEIITTSHH